MRDNKKCLWLKVVMYFTSLWLLFLIILLIRVVDFDGIGKITGLDDFTKLIRFDNVSVICVALLAICLVLVCVLRLWRKGAKDLPVKINSIEEKNYEYLTFFTTYIIPFVCFDLDETKNVVLMFVLLVVIGIIFVKSGFYIANPTLALFGYRLYQVYVDGEDKSITVICKGELFAGDYIESISFDSKNWYVRRRHDGKNR